MSYLESDDLKLLDFLVGRANSNRSDIVRQAIRKLHSAVVEEMTARHEAGTGS